MVDPIQFQIPQAFSAFDFSPLARLANQPQQDLGGLAAKYGVNPPDASTPTAPASRAAFTGDKQGVAKSVASELKAQGFSDNAIAGILYNVGQESGFDPTLRHPDQPNYTGEAHFAHGLYQEGGDEWNTFAATQPKDWQDPVEQTRYVAGRLKGDIGNKQYSEVNKALNAAKTPEDAAKIFARGYLKPADRYLNSRIADISRGIPAVGFYTGE